MIIYMSLRVLAIALGVGLAVPAYSAALSENHGRSRSAIQATRRALALALLWTILAAAGVVGWAR